MANDNRHIVISADCHGGADLKQYRDYLDSCYLDDFDEWAKSFVNPYDDMKGPNGYRNWDSSRRLSELASDGIVAEVIYPNTVPPFFTSAALASSQGAVANARDLEYRWAGLKAHNRWLLEFCQDAPGRRAGVFHIMLHDVDAAVAEVRWARDAGLTGGVLLPGAPPGSGVPPLYRHSSYDRLWDVCEDLEVPVNCHGGGAGPRTGTTPLDHMFFLLDLRWWDITRFRHLVLGGVLERHPGLTVVLTESGIGWIPRELRKMDRVFESVRGKGGGDMAYDADSAIDGLSLRPSEYWHRQCYAGATFVHPTEVEIRDQIGIDKILWGSDYPHLEATYPYSKAAMQTALKDVPVAEAEQILAGNAARMYGFDLDRLRAVAEEVGPRHDEVFKGVDVSELPADAAGCPAFAGLMSGSAKTRMGDNRAARK
ncbi:amidohydrolase family protein [Streptomyces odontomachi]|uniref:amidohydrolase family protein n=1 Tax=Streptomyces odontomachi TaxID=2944940 RepID=UPI00210ABD1A|nr:amidohydrolase family protein [Streptomyces sp. ODS25]